MYGRSQAAAPPDIVVNWVRPLAAAPAAYLSRWPDEHDLASLVLPYVLLYTIKY